ncbi:DUF4352 domain-containing protein [Evansella clarkii]|uniref:DUF4352 domain-containing protein n=1 Tax=Evansella clarkii TaxID=79879 RepID=UPI000997A9CE|nr:DUF4352 domain-containing protein [Evansella clarkii]
MKKILSVLSLSTILMLAACGESEVTPVEGSTNNNSDNDNTEVNESNNNGNEENDNVADNEDNDANDNEGSEEGGDQEESVSIGDTINFDGLEITINDAYSTDGGEFDEAEYDHFVVLDLTIENTTEEAANVSTLLQMSLQDEEGYTHDPAFMMDLKGTLDGEIGPGRDNRGEVGFDVNESGVYEFIFEHPFTTGQAIWEIEID